MRFKKQSSSLFALTAAFLVVQFLFLSQTKAVPGCPFCGPASLTLSEQISQADVAVIAKWVSAEKPDIEKQTYGVTIYEVTDVLNAASDSELKKGSTIKLDRYRSGKEGDKVVLTGVAGTQVAWSSPLSVTKEAQEYIKKLPSPENDPAKRLEFFLGHLENSDQLISDDAYNEFANAPYEQVTQLKDKMPHEKLRKWIKDPKTSVTRLGFYGLLLGLCGDEKDKTLMEAKITEQTTDYRLGIDGVMGGYLLLAGDKGLDLLDKTKIQKADDPNKQAPFSEVYAAMQALRFMWEYGDGKISKDRLRESMRILLDRPDLTDLVINDLARWEDWDASDKLIAMYGKKEYDLPTIKRAIAGFFIICAKDVPEGENVKKPAHVIKAEKFIAKLEEEDPKTMKHARRLYR